MASYTNEQLMEMYQRLPKDIQDAIMSVDTAAIVREIGAKHKLMIDKIGELADETGLVMLGLTHPSEFIGNLNKRLEVDRGLAKEIADEINSRIFFPIRETLKKIHGIGEEEETQVEIKPPEVKPLEPSPPPPTESSEPMVGPAPVTEPEMPKPEFKMPPEAPAEPATVDLSKSSMPSVTLDALGRGVGAGIFETKTKEEVFRSPMETVEKPAQPQPPQPVKEKEDPYREPI